MASAARHLYHVEFDVAARSKGHCAARRLAYQTADRATHAFGRSDFRTHRAEHVTTWDMLPADAPEWAHDRYTLWARAVAAETRSNAQECRTGEITIPREVPRHLWRPFAEACLAPLVAEGMAVTASIHCPAASDGQEQPHVHFMATMRKFDDATATGFAKDKTRHWNDLFASFAGGKVAKDKTAIRGMRQVIADRMNAFCRAHSIAYHADPRTLAEQGIDCETEPQIPRWRIEAHKRGITQADVIDLQQFRAARAEAEAARADADRLDAELAAPRPRPGDARLGVAVAAVAAARQPRQGQQSPPRAWQTVAPVDNDQARQRRAAFRRRMANADRRPSGRAIALREAYQLDGWMPATAVQNIERIAYDPRAGAVHILLKDGTRIRDDGHMVSLSGPLTDQAATELIAAAKRRGWTEVEVHGTKEFRDAMAVRLALEEPPVAVTNHPLPTELRRQVEDELARCRAADRQQRPVPEAPLASLPPHPEAAAAAWLHGRAVQRRRAAAELVQAREIVLDRGAKHNRATDNALFALSSAERALAAHRAAGQPAGMVARLSGRAATWQKEEQRLNAARAEAEAELDRLREEKRLAHDLAVHEAVPLQRQAEEQRRQAEALERVAVAARRGDPRACAVAARQDDEAALRLAEQLRRDHEHEERRRRAEREAELARQRQQGPTPGPRRR